jgi:hypothetical protein
MAQQSKDYPNLRRIPLVLNLNFPEDAELWEHYEPLMARRRASDDIRRRLWASIFGSAQPENNTQPRPIANRSNGHRADTETLVAPPDEDTQEALGNFLDTF